jgi:hypothetical protein
MFPVIQIGKFTSDLKSTMTKNQLIQSTDQSVGEGLAGATSHPFGYCGLPSVTAATPRNIRISSGCKS